MGKLLLLGYFGAGNLGDDCFAADWLRRWATELNASRMTCDFATAGTLNPLAGFIEQDELEPLAGDCIPRARLLLANPAQYAALVAPGGSLLQNATSLRSQLFYLHVIRRFARASVPVYLLGQGIGPLRGFIAKTSAPQGLSLTKLLGLRDTASHEWAKQQLALVAHREMYYGADPLLAGRLAAPRIVSGSYAVLIPKSGRGPTPPDEKLVGVLRSISGKIRELRLTCYTAALHAGQDSLLTELICAEQNALAVTRPLLGEHYGSSLLGLLAGAQFVVSYRLHGLILAAAYGVPGLGVAYDPKVSAFCKEMGLPSLTPQDVLKGRGPRAVEELWQNRDTLSRTLQIRRQSALERLGRVEQRFGEMLWGRRQ